jgi:hypothetical protein
MVLRIRSADVSEHGACEQLHRGGVHAGACQEATKHLCGAMPAFHRPCTRNQRRGRHALAGANQLGAVHLGRVFVEVGLERDRLAALMNGARKDGLRTFDAAHPQLKHVRARIVRVVEVEHGLADALSEAVGHVDAMGHALGRAAKHHLRLGEEVAGNGQSLGAIEVHVAQAPDTEEHTDVSRTAVEGGADGFLVAKRKIGPTLLARSLRPGSERENAPPTLHVGERVVKSGLAHDPPSPLGRPLCASAASRQTRRMSHT